MHAEFLEPVRESFGERVVKYGEVLDGDLVRDFCWSGISVGAEDLRSKVCGVLTGKHILCLLSL